jgi:uncharacterized protein (DUF58 family)
MALPPPLPRRRAAKPPPPPPRQRKTWRYLSHKDLVKFKDLFFAARVAVEGAYAGRHKSPFRGVSPEFVEYRVYNPGDPIDSIDWKAFARTDRYYIKMTEKETDMNCYVLLDSSASMGYGGTEFRGHLPGAAVSKLDYASFLAAALTYMIVKQGDKVSLTLFDEQLRKHIPAGGTFPHLYTIMHELEKRRARGATSLAATLKKTFALCARRGLLIILSDFHDDAAAIFKALSLYTHRRFEIIIFHILHEYEHRLPPFENVRFVDAETGEEMTCSTADIRDSYNRQIQEFIHNIRSASRARNIDYHYIHTGIPYDRALHQYLLKRNTVAR